MGFELGEQWAELRMKKYIVPYRLSIISHILLDIFLTFSQFFGAQRRSELGERDGEIHGLLIALVCTLVTATKQHLPNKGIFPFSRSYIMDGIKFILLEINPDLIDAWKRAFTDHNLPLGNFSIVQSKLQDLPDDLRRFDCVVSPANSYGRLDGG